MSLKNSLALITSAILIGFLTGLSSSPVIAQIIIILLGGVVSAISILSGMDKEKLQSYSRVITLIPFFYFIISMTCGTLLGLYVRVNNYFGSDYQNEIQYWSVQTGIDKTAVAKEIFKSLYSNNTATIKEIDSSKKGLLKSFNISQCEAYCSLSGKNLVRELQTSGSGFLLFLTEKLNEDELERATKLLCECN